VRIVPARVHHADRLSFVFAFHLAGERHVDLLDDRQGVHVGAERDDRPRLRAVHDGDDAVARNAGFGIEAEAPQRVRDELRRFHLAVRQFRVFVKRASPGDHVLLDGGGALVDLRRERRRGSDRRRRRGLGGGERQEREQGQHGWLLYCDTHAMTRSGGSNPATAFVNNAG
jgi:hypothetical protein